MPYPHTYILIPYTKDRRARVLETLDAIQRNTDIKETPHSVVLYENDYIGYPNAILNMVEHINGYVFMGASDLILGPDWLTILWRNFDGKGAIEPFNEIQGGGLVQHPLIHSDLVKKYFNRHYFHYFADNEMHERITKDGLYTYCPEAPMEHRHVVNGKAQMDDCYRVVMNKEKNDKDRETYLARKAANWP